MQANAAGEAWFYRFPRGLPLLLFALMIAATLFGIAAIERGDAAARQLMLERNASEIAGGIERRSIEANAALTAAAALFATRGEPDAGMFARFVDHIRSDGNLRAELWMGWAPVVQANAIGAFTAARRVDYADFAVRPNPAPDAGLVAPIALLEPATERNRRAIGFDIASEPIRRDALLRAMRSGRSAASGKLHFMQDAERPSVPGFVIYMPVTDPARPGKVIGFVYSPFGAANFLADVGRNPLGQKLGIAIYDRELAPDALLAEHRLSGATGNSVLRMVTVGDRTWVVEVVEAPAPRLTLSSRLTLALGTALALLVMLISRLVIRRGLADRAVLEQMSRETAIRISLTRELNHRVKNTLANVLSIVSLTRRRARSLDEFADALSGRVRALSATHDLLSQTDWTDAAIGAVVRSELAPYMGEGDRHVALKGPEIALAPNDAMSLGLAIHELATNAAKYGALSSAEGCVHVSWHLMRPGLAELWWREEGGPPVGVTAKRGFGRDLLERIVAHELRHAVELNFAPGGVECRLRVPVRRAGEFRLREG